MKFNKVFNEEYNTRFTTKPSDTGDTDLSPSADYKSFTSSNIIPKEIDNGYEEFSTKTIDDKKWKNNRNKFAKMDWEQPEPNESDFASPDVQDIFNYEKTRLAHNKSSYKQAYKKHEIPDNTSTQRLVKIDDKVGKDDPLMWKYYRMFYRPKNKVKN